MTLKKIHEVLQQAFDAKPPDDKRKIQQIFLRPSLRAEIDKRRGKLSRSVWIERAIYAQLARERI